MGKHYDNRKIYLNAIDATTYFKEWSGLEFKIVVMKDSSLKFYAPEVRMQILTCQDEDDPYYIASLYGGKGFIRFLESHKEPGTLFASLTITEDAVLPKGKQK